MTRSHTFDQPVSTVRDLYGIARALLARTAARTRPVRLLGIGADSLVAAADPRQLDLGPRSWDELEEVVEEVRGRFGSSAVARARLLDTDGNPPRSPGAE